MTATEEVSDDVRENPLAHRATFNELMGLRPLPAGTRATHQVLGGVPTLAVDPGGPTDGRIVLFLHGGGHIAGSPRHVAALAGRVAAELGATALVPDFRLAPEAPFPADVDDAAAVFEALPDPGRVVIAGESAGGGLVLSLLLALRDRGRRMPVGAWVMSPWVDPSLSGDSMVTKDGVDAIFTRGLIAELVPPYLVGTAADDPAVNPLVADLRGLPPMVIQVGSAEVLLDDAVRLAARAALFDVPVQLDVASGRQHVFQNRPDEDPEADAALRRGAAFLSPYQVQYQMPYQVG